MLTKDYSLNLKRSLYRFLRERLSASYYINYMASGDEELEQRIQEPGGRLLAVDRRELASRWPGDFQHQHSPDQR